MEDQGRGGINAILIPLLLGGALVVALFTAWQKHAAMEQVTDIAHIEEESTVEIRAALAALRAGDTARVLELTQKLNDKTKKYVQNLPTICVRTAILEGEALLRQDSVKSESAFERAVSLLNRSGGITWEYALLGRGRARLANNKATEAVEDFDLILRHNAMFGAAYYWRARAHAALGNTTTAARDEADARRLDAWPPKVSFLQ